MSSEPAYNEESRKIWNKAITAAAAIAKSKIDPEWPGDDLSRQAEATESEILELKV